MMLRQLPAGLTAAVALAALSGCGEDGQSINPGRCPDLPSYNVRDLDFRDNLSKKQRDALDKATATLEDDGRCITGPGEATTLTTDNGGGNGNGNTGGMNAADAGPGGGPPGDGGPDAG